MKKEHEFDEARAADSRRSFLKTAGLGAAALSLGSVLKPAALGQNLLASSSPLVPGMGTTPMDDTSSPAGPYGFKYLLRTRWLPF